jgi:hypothetical protein
MKSALQQDGEALFAPSAHSAPPLNVRFGSCVTSIAGRNGMRNCTRDEGGPFEIGNQVLVSSHRKLLSSKAMVVSVAEKTGTRFRQARLREASASEPPAKCRKRSDDAKIGG